MFQLIRRGPANVKSGGRPSTLDRETLQRKIDANQQPWFCILSPNASVVHMDGALRDSQPQTNAAGFRVTRVVHAKERLEYLREGFRWNARTKIANGNGGVQLRGVQGDFDRASWRSVPYGVSKNVLHGAAQQHRIGQQFGPTQSGGDQVTIASSGFDFAILNEFVQEIIERHEFQLQGAQIAFLPSYLQQALSQVGKPIDLLI